MSRPFTLINTTPAYVGNRYPKRLKRASFKTLHFAQMVEKWAADLGMVTRVVEVAGGHAVYWAPDWEDFWPA